MGKKPKTKKTDSPFDIATALKNIGATTTNDIRHFRSPYHINTGLFNLDFILSDGRGIPTSVIQYYGGENSGKTTAALQAMQGAQKRGMDCFYINAERALTESLVKCFPDLDSTKVQWIDPDGGEAALNAMKIILKTVPEAFVVLDSVPACLPKEVLDNEAGKKEMARLASLFAPVMPDFKRLAWANKSVVLLINQVRDNLSPMGYKPVIPGGHALKFYSDIRVRFRSGAKIKQDGNIIGHDLIATVDKTRGQGAHKQSTSTLIYGRGFDPCFDILRTALSFGIVTKNGSWITFDDKNKAQGEIGAVEMMRADDQLRESLESQVVDMLT